MQAIKGVSIPHSEADEDNFILPASMQRLLGRNDELPVRLYRVTFGEGSRTNWHLHNDIQVLFGLSGICLVANRQGSEILLNPGDVVVIDPEEEHWHGAAPGEEGEHLAINLGTDTTWLDKS